MSPSRFRFLYQVCVFLHEGFVFPSLVRFLPLVSFPCPCFGFQTVLALRGSHFRCKELGVCPSLFPVAVWPGFLCLPCGFPWPFSLLWPSKVWSHAVSLWLPAPVALYAALFSGGLLASYALLRLGLLWLPYGLRLASHGLLWLDLQWPPSPPALRVAFFSSGCLAPHGLILLGFHTHRVP